MGTTTRSLAAAQRRAAARRVKAREGDRAGHRASLKNGIANADTPERVAQRAERLRQHYTGEPGPLDPREMPRGAPRDIMSRAVGEVERALGPAVADVALAGVKREPEAILERIINSNDLVGVRYLESGSVAARAVGRVQIDDSPGHLEGYGTGSMVSPRLLLTNHHVLPSAEFAAASSIEFNFQLGMDGNELAPTSFPFDPDAFFLNDEDLDFALVAVRAEPSALAQFGWNPLIEAEGKVIIGESVTIVQHPGGGMKQIALRDNRLIDVLPDFLHYEADTEPGSSGSPVFNDQWEIVALHHASVPAGAEDPSGFVNEGIRVSKVLAFIHESQLPTSMRALKDQLFDPGRIERRQAVVSPSHADPGPPSQSVVRSRRPAWKRDDQAAQTTSAGVTVPLEITITLGQGALHTIGPDAGTEAVTIDPDYASRTGYDPAFLGVDDSLRVRLPKVSALMRARATTRPHERGHWRYVLPYHHYSVVMNRERRLAYFTAVNIDGTLSRRPPRETDRWFLDPRIPVEYQTGEDVYADNDLDRGHLVRRLDPAWGSSDEAAKIANDDTFHFTNCSPQHRDFNQNTTTWAGLENYVLDNADNRDIRVCVFSGPVLADDDDVYRGVQLPRQFWKVVTMVKTDGTLSATGYLLSQADLIQGLEATDDFSYGAYRTFQVPISHIEGLTGLTIDVAAHDPLGGEGIESAALREIGGPEDLIL